MGQAHTCVGVKWLMEYQSLLISKSAISKQKTHAIILMQKFLMTQKTTVFRSHSRSVSCTLNWIYTYVSILRDIPELQPWDIPFSHQVILVDMQYLPQINNNKNKSNFKISNIILLKNKIESYTHNMWNIIENLHLCEALLSFHSIVHPVFLFQTFHHVRGIFHI